MIISVRGLTMTAPGVVKRDKFCKGEDYRLLEEQQLLDQYRQAWSGTLHPYLCHC